MRNLFERCDLGLGSKADISHCTRHVRFTPGGATKSGIWLLRLCATTRLAKTKLLGLEDSKPNALAAATVFFEILVISAGIRGYRNAARMLYFFLRTACICMQIDQLYAAFGFLSDHVGNRTSL